ncbi:MAG: hypothetical protein FD165_815, partial [Gammaproteobacteria bacterium]
MHTTRLTQIDTRLAMPLVLTISRCLMVSALLLASLAVVTPADAGPFTLNFTPQSGRGGDGDDD